MGTSILVGANEAALVWVLMDRIGRVVMSFDDVFGVWLSLTILNVLMLEPPVKSRIQQHNFKTRGRI